MALLARFSAVLLVPFASAATIEQRFSKCATRTATEDAMLQMDDECGVLQTGGDKRSRFVTLEDHVRMGSGDDEAMLQIMGNPDFAETLKQDDEAMFQMASEPLELDRDEDL